MHPQMGVVISNGCGQAGESSVDTPLRVDGGQQMMSGGVTGHHRLTTQHSRSTALTTSHYTTLYTAVSFYGALKSRILLSGEISSFPKKLVI